MSESAALIEICGAAGGVTVGVAFSARLRESDALGDFVFPTMTVTISVPAIPVPPVSETSASITWMPAENKLYENMFVPSPISVPPGGLVQLQKLVSVISPSSGSIAVPSKGMFSPTRKFELSAGLVIVTTGGPVFAASGISNSAKEILMDSSDATRFTWITISRLE